jgi:hypothetical protein
MRARSLCRHGEATFLSRLAERVWLTGLDIAQFDYPRLDALEAAVVYLREQRG